MLNTPLRHVRSAWGASLPREARDTLFLLVVIAWVVALQAAHIPWWTSVLTAAVLLWRARLAFTTQPLPQWPWRLGLLALTLGATWLTHRTLLGRDAGVTLIVVLLALKTLELRARRDAFVVFFLAFFTLLTHFFYSQSLLTAAGILVALLGLLTALVNAHMPVGRPPLVQAARMAGGMALLGAPIMLVLFLLFPRMAPLWGLPADAVTGRSGISGEMRVGDMAQLALDDSVALRLRFDGPPPPQREVYLRGPVLSAYDGERWRVQRPSFGGRNALEANLQVQGEPLRYEVTMEPSQRNWLYLLEATPEPPALPRDTARMTPDLRWNTFYPITERTRYRATSYPRFTHGPLQPVLGLQDALELPASFNPRTLALAQELRREVGPGPDNAPAGVSAALERLRTGGYTYTLEPGVFGQHTADEFWFDRKQGFCEHIASSFVVLMRGMDIPARIVTGYQGGQVNVVDGFYTVRQSDAHAWAEVWLQGQGWVRVDPTAAVSPARVGTLERLTTPDNVFTSTIRTFNPTLATQLRNAWEAVNNRWNQWVLNYTDGQQMNLLKRLGFEAPSWTDLAYVLIGVVVLVSLAGAAWQLWERQQHDPWLRLLHHCHQHLRRLGLPSAGHAPPRELAAQVTRHFGDTPATRSVTQWLLRLEAQRYARESSDSLATLRRQYRQLAWPARTPP